MRRRSRSIVPAVLIGIALAAAGCSNGDGDAAGSSSEPSDAVDADSNAITTEVDASTSGRTEVGLITTLPRVDLSWEQPVLELPTPQQSEIFLANVSIIDGEYVAVAFGWTPLPDGQVVYTWQSSDGAEWSVSTLELPAGQSMYRVAATDDRLFAFGDRSTEVSYIPFVYSWDGANGWMLVDLATSGVDLEGVEIVGAASTEAGVVLGGRRDRYAADPSPATFQADELEFELDDAAGTFVVTDIGSGKLIASGLLSEIYPHAEEGQAIYDMETRQLLTVVPWEVWEGQHEPVSPLPIPIPGPSDAGSGQATIEWDGFEITLDEATDSFTIVDQGSGGVISSGPLADLYRGPAPAFFDPDSDELLIEFTWEEWWGLLEQAYESQTEPHQGHTAEHVVFFSADGTQWSEQVLDQADNTHLDAVVAVDDRFVVSVVEHVEFGAVRRAYVSENGTDWTDAAGTGPEYLYEARSGPQGAIALTDVQGSSALATSSDGLTWSTGLFLPTQSDGRHGWLRLVAAGGLGRSAMATIDAGPSSELLEITVGSRTATFGGSESALQIGDDATGDILLELSWQQLEEPIGDAGYATYADGATSFYAADGALLMTISDEQAFAAFEQQEVRRRSGTDHVAFIELDGAWFEADLPVPDAAVPEQLAVGSDVILVGTNAYGPHLGESRTTGIGLLVGRVEETFSAP